MNNFLQNENKFYGHSPLNKWDYSFMHGANCVLLILKFFTFKNDLMVKLLINTEQVLAKH